MAGAMRLGIALAIVAQFAGSAVAQNKTAKERAAEHFQQGEAYWKVKAYDRAIVEYEAAHALVPRAGFLFNIGLCHESLGNKAEAIDYYRQYLASAPKGAKATEARARATQLEREVADAKRAADEQQARAAAQAERQRKIDALVSAGDANAKAARHDEAVAAYRAAQRLSNDAEMLYRIATVFEAEGDAKEALVHYDSYLARAPSGANAVDARRRARGLRDAEAAAARVVPPDRGKTARTFGYGVKLGLNSNRVGLASGTSDTCSTPDAVVGPVVGLVASYAPADYFAVQAEALYVGKSLEVSCDATDHMRVDTRYLELPVLARLTRSADFGGAAVYGGALIGFPLTESVDSSSVQFDDRGPALGLAIGLEGGISLGPGRLVIDVRLAGTDQKFHTEGVAQLDFESEANVSVTLGYVVR